MINLFAASQNDMSLQYLRKIFGSMNGVIYNPSGQVTQGGITSLTQPETTIGLLGTMFQMFNGVVLTVGILIVVYVTVLGVMLTAHEGEFMGKKWSNLWLPIRTVLGVASLVPTASGYCALQIIMMWVIVQGIGAADSLWNTALAWISIAGSPYAQLTIPSTDATSAMASLFDGLVCQASFAYTPEKPDPNNSIDASYYCVGKQGGCDAPTQAPTIDANSNAKQLGPKGICGTFTYCNQNAACNIDPSKTTAEQNAQRLGCEACKAQVKALGGDGGTNGIVNVLYQIATKVVQADYAYRQFVATSGAGQNPNQQQGGQQLDTQFIKDFCSANNIDPCCVTSPGSAAAKALGISVANLPNCRSQGDFPEPNNSQVGEQSAGNAAGKLYWPYVIKPNYGTDNFISASVSRYVGTISEALKAYITEQSRNRDALRNDLKAASDTGWIFAGAYYYTIAKTTGNNLSNAVPEFNVSTADTTSSQFQAYRNNYRTAGLILEAMANETSSLFRASPTLSPFSGPIGATFNSVSETFKTTTQPSEDTDPVAQVQTAGQVLLVLVEVLYPALLALTVGLGLVGCFDVYVLGTGVNDPICGTLTLTYFILIPGLFALMGYMVTLGGLLGVYVPLIPYVLFTFGAIGWMISTVEAMVAGPLVALGILSPSGQHELLGKSEPALMLLFNVFLRPSLMIFGMIAAMLLANVVIKMINYAFWTTVAGSVLLGDPLGLIIFLCAYVMLIVAALNKVFQAIHIVPERVMRWIGGQGEQYGEAEAVQEAKGGVQAAGAGARGGMESLKGKAESSVAAKRKQALKAEEGSKAEVSEKKGEK